MNNYEKLQRKIFNFSQECSFVCAERLTLISITGDLFRLIVDSAEGKLICVWSRYSLRFSSVTRCISLDKTRIFWSMHEYCVYCLKRKNQSSTEYQTKRTTSFCNTQDLNFDRKNGDWSAAGGLIGIDAPRFAFQVKDSCGDGKDVILRCSATV